jgi:hypothetical protein
MFCNCIFKRHRFYAKVCLSFVFLCTALINHPLPGLHPLHHLPSHSQFSMIKSEVLTTCYNSFPSLLQNRNVLGFWIMLLVFKMTIHVFFPIPLVTQSKTHRWFYLIYQKTIETKWFTQPERLGPADLEMERYQIFWSFIIIFCA